MGILYVVPTPVGNLEDITLRAIRILREADFVLAEDTRTSAKLLKHLEIQVPMYSHHKFNEHKTVGSLVERINTSERHVALISDAGTPAISDPGFMLVRECVRNGVEVQCRPGATAFVPALVCSGLPCDKFVFEGFLPQKKGRQTRLNFLKDEQRTTIFYESAAVREISKLHEECVRGTLAELVQHFTANEPRGEFVLLVGGVEDKRSADKD